MLHRVLYGEELGYYPSSTQKFAGFALALPMTMDPVQNVFHDYLRMAQEISSLSLSRKPCYDEIVIDFYRAFAATETAR